MKRFYAGLVLLVFCFAAQSVLAAPYAYITQVEYGTVTVFDTVKNKKVTTIDVGGNPYSITMSPDGRKAYVISDSYPNAGWVSVIDVLTHTVTNTITIPGNSPLGVAVLPNGSKLYVADCGDAPGITVINTSSNTFDKTILFGTCPSGVAMHPDGSKAYITDWSDNLVARIDMVSDTVDMTVTVGHLPEGIAVHPEGNIAYVANWQSQNISVIDTSNNNVTETISLQGTPRHLTFNPSGSRAYVTGWGGSVWVIDTDTRAVIATIDVGYNFSGGGVDVTPDGAYAYVTTGDWDDEKNKPINSGIKMIEASTNTVKKKIKLPGEPLSLGKFIGGPQYHMTVQTAGSGSGKVISKKLTDIDCGNGGSKCEADFYVNRKIQLQAIAADGFVFTGWSGACTKKSKTCKLLITDDYSVTATFEPK